MFVDTFKHKEWHIFLQLSPGGGGGDIGKKISHGGGDGGDDDGDDDDYFDDFDDEGDGDEGGLFRRRKFLEEVVYLVLIKKFWQIFPLPYISVTNVFLFHLQLFDSKFVEAVLNEWQRTMMDLPAGFRQACEMV